MKLIEFVRACLNNPPAVLSLSAALSPSQVSLLSSLFTGDPVSSRPSD